MLRPFQIWLLFLLGLALVLPPMGWLTVKALELDRAELAARQQVELEERVSRALWRMDVFLSPLLAQEAARPEFLYKPVLATLPAGKGKIRVTYNALGDNIKPMPQAEATEIVQGLGVVEPYLLSVGTRWPRKNLALAIEASKLAGQRLVITGKPGWGAVPTGAQYTDYVSDRHLTALYQCASLYLAPSFHEGFGIPLLEAFACQCPVLCSSGGALPEVSGGAAEVMQTFAPSEWAARIDALMADSSKLEAMRLRGLKRVKDFDWNSVFRSYVRANCSSRSVGLNY